MTSVPCRSFFVLLKVLTVFSRTNQKLINQMITVTNDHSSIIITDRNPCRISMTGINYCGFLQKLQEAHKNRAEHLATGPLSDFVLSNLKSWPNIASFVIEKLLKCGQIVLPYLRSLPTQALVHRNLTYSQAERTIVMGCPYLSMEKFFAPRHQVIW